MHAAVRVYNLAHPETRKLLLFHDRRRLRNATSLAETTPTQRLDRNLSANDTASLAHAPHLS